MRAGGGPQRLRTQLPGSPFLSPTQIPTPTHLGSQGGEHKALCGVGPESGWASAHFLQPHPCTSKPAEALWSLLSSHAASRRAG